jgi:hypothetical protein
MLAKPNRIRNSNVTQSPTMGKRSFDELSVVATGIQNLQDRFGKRRCYEYDDLPQISHWRANLVRGGV